MITLKTKQIYLKRKVNNKWWAYLRLLSEPLSDKELDMYTKVLEHKIESSTTRTVGLDFTIEELLEELNTVLLADKLSVEH